MIYGDFESILIPKNNGRWNSDEPYANKCQNNVECGYCYKLVCVDDQFSKPFKLYLVQDAVHKFIINLFKQSKYCSHVMKNYFKKSLVMTKENEKTFWELYKILDLW